MLDVKADYNIGKLCGKGNFAKVHCCTPVNDNKQKYALKTIDKAKIVRTRNSIVSHFKVL